MSVVFPESFLEKKVAYLPVTQVLNNDGVPYDDYGIHNDLYDIDGIFYEGYRDTKVFAYIGFPKHPAKSGKIPAVVCVHGGGGKAYLPWVKHWNDRGFAAISMDLYSDGPEPEEEKYPDMKTHPYAGLFPWNGDETFLEDYENASMYQNVVNVIYAHNLMRSFPEIDTDCMGIVGVSWGGVTTTIMLGADPRYAYAIPIYGCGHFKENICKFRMFSEPPFSPIWDPANFAKKAPFPVYYVSGDVDFAFSVNSLSLTYEDTPDAYLSVTHNLEHSQHMAEALSQPYDFARRMIQGKTPCIRIYDESVKDGVCSFSYDAPEDLEPTRVRLYYLTDAELPLYDDDHPPIWKLSIGTLQSGTARVTLPEEATYGYATLLDKWGAAISSTKFMKF